MESFYPRINLPEILQLQATNLLNLVQNFNSYQANIPANLSNDILPEPKPSFRTIHEIVLDIEKGQGERISALEWIYCIYTKQDWDNQYLHKSQTTSEMIWRIAQQNSWLKHRLFWRLSLFYSDQTKNCLASSLVNSFSNYQPQDKLDKIALEILEFIEKNSPEDIAHLSWQHLLSPDQLLARYQLPPQLPIVGQALDYVTVKLILNINSVQEKQVNWLLTCFDKMTKNQQKKEVEKLLSKVSSKVGGKCHTLVNWLQKNYGSTTTNSRWSELSSEAKAALRKWIGAVNYQDFEKLINLLISRLPLETWEQNQLKKRKGFWANYSDRFQRLRILLSSSSAQVLKDQFNHEDVSILVEDNSEPTEICIFDFGDRYIVEFFRGSGSETRLFKANSTIEKELFQSYQLSVKRLRSLQGGETHDHVFCWQRYCEEWLRKNGIYPNEGITYFQGLSRSHNQYNSNRGLPFPSEKDQKKREYQMIGWWQKIAKLEQEARQYCNAQNSEFEF